ncbi:Coiled-coil domain-containing protein 15 [Myotis brandtii]|uniref:Coiled-coil domain-containing protein 15 n=1 Tax=Myotis brandtii TaxID=109478 RepID=S7N0S9_MYOBR|nr:PREDICTED: coiled-coil domain-containing protein 15 isoform X1 [Myotis brandtii]EPQ10569.1 Coiled-coil domain-containing protein 15 [Myotis brandtii]
MPPLKKRRNTPKLPLALNPRKSKDVLAVLAERNQPVVPVGAWVEPASPHSSGNTAYTAAYVIEKEIKEQLRKKQEALKHFQRQAKHRVNQRVRLRKKQQLQKFYEEAEKEDTVGMLPSDLEHFTSKRTGVFPKTLNAAIGSAWSPSSQKLDDGIQDRENENQLIQHAQALRKTMKQARHQLASFKTMSQKYAAVFPLDTRKSCPTQQEPDSEESSSITIDKKGKEKLFWKNQQGFFSEEKNKTFSRVQKIQLKTPLYAVIEEEQLNELQDILPETQDYLSETQGDLLETQGDLTGVQSVKLEAQNIEPHSQAVELAGHPMEGQVVEPKAQAIELKVQVVKIEPQSLMLEAQSIELEDGNMLEVHDFLSPNQAFLPKDQNILPNDQNILLKCQDQHILRKDQHVFLKDQDIQPKYQDQDFIPKCPDQHILRKDQHVFPKDQDIQPKYQDQDFIPKCPDQHILCKDQHVFPKDQDIQPKYQDQDFIPKCPDQHILCKDQHVFPKDQDIQPKYQDQDFMPKCPNQHFIRKDQHILANDQNSVFKFQHQHFLPREQCVLTKDQHVFSNEQNTLCKCQDQDFLPRYQKVRFKEPYSVINEKGRDGFSLTGYPKVQDQVCIRDQSLYSRQQPSVGTAERWRDLLLDGHQYLPAKHRREASNRRQVYDKYQSGWNTEFQTPLGLQFGVNQEEDKKERQKRYLRYRRLFMDIEREKVKEQQRQKECRKRTEKIKRKKEQQRYAEEQRILKMNFHEEPYSGEKMSEMLAQLQLEEMKEAREKQQRRERECQRYLEALRVQIQEKMRLYNITLPPLCGCGPDFWDAHPNTCANNCIFYKNHRAYTRALYSVINSCDRGTLILRAAIHNFVSAYRRTLKNVYSESEINC